MFIYIYLPERKSEKSYALKEKTKLSTLESELQHPDNAKKICTYDVFNWNWVL